MKVRYAQSAGSGMVPGHSLGQGTGCAALGGGKRMCQMSLSHPGGKVEYQVVSSGSGIGSSSSGKGEGQKCLDKR